MKSSYEKNNYGGLFEELVKSCRPSLAVELGVLHGYSTYHIAKALKDFGYLVAYDLFDRYEYNHGCKADVIENLGELNTYVNLVQGDAYEAYKNFEDNSVGFLHVDLSNTGETIRRIMEQWNSKIIAGSLVIFEGGSEERDNVAWMTKYAAPSIRKELQKNAIVNRDYIWGVYELFPSITVMYKRWSKW